jgi:hypothetical protein
MEEMEDLGQTYLFQVALKSRPQAPNRTAVLARGLAQCGLGFRCRRGAKEALQLELCKAQGLPLRPGAGTYTGAKIIAASPKQPPPLGLRPNIALNRVTGGI